MWLEEGRDPGTQGPMWRKTAQGKGLRDRSVSAALTGTMPFSWPSSKPNMAATHGLTHTAPFGPSPPEASLAQASGSLR